MTLRAKLTLGAKLSSCNFEPFRIMIKDKFYLAILLGFMLSSTTKAAYYHSNGECELHTGSDYYDYYYEDELVKLDNVVRTDKSKIPNYYFPNIKLSWLASQKYL